MDRILESLFEHLPIRTWVKDPQGRYLRVNRALSEYVGLPPEQILGKTDFDLFSREEAERYRESDQAVLSGSDQNIQEIFINGHWQEEYKKQIYDSDGTLIGVGGFSRSIDKRKQTEEALRESERSKDVLISNLPGVAYRCKNDKDWTMTFLSNGCYDLTGYLPEELLNNRSISYNQLITEDLQDSLYKKWNEDAKLNRKTSDEYTIRTKTGETKWVWEQAVIVPDQAGNMTESEGFILDITPLKNAQFALNESESRFRAIFEEAPLGVGIFDSDTGIAVQVNRKFEKITGRTKEELLAADWKSYSYPDDIKENNRLLNKLRNQEIREFRMQKRLVRPDGSLIWISMTIVPFETSPDHPKHICMMEDITESKKRQEEIEYLGYHDTLTKLYNRAFFAETQQRLDRSRKFPLSLIMADVNGLKLINDTLGHAVGDLLLQEAARVFRKACRADDIISRIGGDEFVILLEQTDQAEADAICRRIQELIDEYNESNTQRPFYMSISLGVATKSVQRCSVMELLSQSEQMLYRNKNEERKAVRSKMLHAIRDRHDARGAIDVHHHQPFV